MELAKTKATYNFLQNKVDYVSGGNGELFINNILLDECYDIQYSYREMKEPIYGYRSTYFDEIIPGTVLITGQFTINYIHDGYLWSILTADDKLTQNDQALNIYGAASSKIYPNSLFDGFMMKNTLQQYNELRKEFDKRMVENSNLDSKILILESTLLALDTEISDNERRAETSSNVTKDQEETWQKDMWFNNEQRVKDAKAAYDNSKTMLENYAKNVLSITNSDYYLDFSYGSESLNNALNDLVNRKENNEVILDTAFDTLNEQYKTEAENLIEPGFLNSDASQYAKFRLSDANTGGLYNNELSRIKLQKEEIKKSIDKLKAKKLSLTQDKAALDKLKTDLSHPKINNYVVNEGKYKSIASLKLQQDLFSAGDKLKFNSKNRPEDIKKGNIRFQIKFNGLEHKVIEGVHLIGHTHFFGVGGEVVKECYTFLAKRLA